MERVGARRGMRLVWPAAMLAGAVAMLVLTTAAPAALRHRTQAVRVQHIKLVIKSDEERGKKGPDGKWHDAVLPANFKVHRGAKVVVTVLNYDDMPHSFTAPGLRVNAFFMMGSEKKPSKMTFTFKAKRTGRFAWHCNPQCDPWSMKHSGFMKGYVKVVA